MGSHLAKWPFWHRGSCAGMSAMDYTSFVIAGNRS